MKILRGASVVVELIADGIMALGGFAAGTQQSMRAVASDSGATTIGTNCRLDRTSTSKTKTNSSDVLLVIHALGLMRINRP